VRHMKSLLRLLWLSLAVVAVAGCISKAPREVFHAGDEVPPDFLMGPAAMLLTNLDGFSASVVSSLTVPGGQPRDTPGDLLEREGRLIFQPSNRSKTRNALLEAGMIFIWDEATHAGYVLSDSLQAYAPMASTVQGTNIVWETGAATQEEANGHHCRRIEAVIECNDGSSARFMVWQAEDARRLPVRIRTISSLREFTLNFSDIRLVLPEPELFVPPDGFTRYASAVGLMNELIIRQTELIKSKGYNSTGEATSPGVQNWRPSPTY
jgi:hypothetical protein